ncbi:hypothetical protein Mesau_04581 [Mesorhizobium australicum WSM2073]|uniref:Uncharacterized protein n=1 Tax=Mesorhizobium australicum (strain HAMBI 3006 / LMG 24608 / WSM2073) TaxID=754035 RepID=L0KP67_MESAW|nr:MULTISPECIES: hypothetical protein [Mesorhizobium]AGB46911.1 hypothetical protein Mesau_04581 [Mesorhizobium australicum WSM2073]MBZ9679758.1 hypothetical protein [Mesorhizobium sp. CO1-1-2]MBZ9924890.1 hypothetical protein [Mesorhizobium sp. BR1-1-4]MBZ9974703.1 hypothetical protein [Mesorhizobium sp. BR-1-1-10]TPL72174.1 hypothetical protein FJ954_15855 [Mesorhizobium sp. B2-3-15]
MNKKTKIISYAVVLACLAFASWRLILLVSAGQWKGRFGGWRECETFWCYSTGILSYASVVAFCLFALYLLRYRENYVAKLYRDYHEMKGKG